MPECARSGLEAKYSYTPVQQDPSNTEEVERKGGGGKKERRRKKKRHGWRDFSSKQKQARSETRLSPAHQDGHAPPHATSSSMSVVHFRFKNAKEFSKVVFNGAFISLDELTSEIGECNINTNANNNNIASLVPFGNNRTVGGMFSSQKLSFSLIVEIPSIHQNTAQIYQRQAAFFFRLVYCLPDSLTMHDFQQAKRKEKEKRKKIASTPNAASKAHEFTCAKQCVPDSNGGTLLDLSGSFSCAFVPHR